MPAISEEPIRFRCYQCNKLLGVPARKVGSIVACPRCQAELQVPRLEGGGEAAQNPDPSAAVEPPSVVMSPPADPILAIPDVFSVAAPDASPPLDESLIAAISVEAPSIRNRDPSERPAHDVVLSPLVVLAWSLLVLLAVPLAFLAGLLTGHFVWK